MNIQQYLKWTLPVAIMSAIAGPAHASNCNEQSELMQSLGDAYVNLQYSHADNTLSESAAKNLLDAFNRAKLRSGKGIRVSCLGKTNSPQELRIKFDLSDIRLVDTASGRIQLTAWEESSRKALSSVMDLPPAKFWTKDSKNSYSSTQLFRHTNKRLTTPDDSYSEDYLDASYSQNYLYAPGKEAEKYLGNPELTITELALDESELLDLPNREGSYVAEIKTMVSKGPTGTIVTQTFYVNGYKAEWVTWHLDS